MSDKQNQSTLVIFTLNYPFGKGEEFIESEMAIASLYYEKIYIVPNNVEGACRLIPENAEVFDFIATNRQVVMRALPEFLGVYFRDLFLERNVLAKLKSCRVYYQFFKDQWRRFGLIKAMHARWVAAGKALVYYDFWLVNNGLALAMLAREADVEIYSNTHSYDLYDSRWGCPVPFRSLAMASQRKVFPDSMFGLRYLNSKVGPALHDRIELSYMGTPDYGMGPVPGDGKLVVVSCSSCTHHKRVDRIVDALLELDSADIEWIHFGDGPLYDEIRERASCLKHMTCTFKGWVTSEALVDFYRTHPVNVFVHASEAEGLPVSLMIAASFGIPIIALDAMGIGELVRPGHGVLLEQTVSSSDLAATIDEVARARSRDEHYRQAGRDYWASHFSLQNYHDLHGAKMRHQLNSIPVTRVK